MREGTAVGWKDTSKLFETGQKPLLNIHPSLA